MTRLGDRSLRWEALSERLNVFAIHRTLYRALGGRLVGRNVLILTTKGRKTGRRRRSAGSALGGWAVLRMGGVELGWESALWMPVAMVLSAWLGSAWSR